jgi:hypothetical protein
MRSRVGIRNQSSQSLTDFVPIWGSSAIFVVAKRASGADACRRIAATTQNRAREGREHRSAANRLAPIRSIRDRNRIPTA